MTIKTSTDKKAYALLKNAQPIQGTPSTAMKSFMVVALVITMVVSAWAAYFHWKAPKGAITSPTKGAQTSFVVEIEGYTKNIPIDRKYLWVTVDVPGLGLCWPKRQIFRTNTFFDAKIVEEGPNQSYTVALYAVDRNHHDEIRHWFEECRITGCEPGHPILPEEFRLDSVKLKLQKIG